MALDDVIKARNNFGNISNLANAIQEKPTDPNNHMNLLAHYVSNYGLAEPDARTMLDFAPGKDYARPEAIQYYAGQAYGADRNTLKNAVKGKLEEIINNADEKKLVDFASIMPDETKKYLNIAKAAKEGNFGAVAEALIKKYDNPIWQDYIRGLHNALSISGHEEHVGRQLSNLANNYVAEKRVEFINQKLSDKVEEEKDGKKKIKYVPNIGKIRDYVKKTFGSYKDSDPIKEELYFHLAGTLK